MPTPTRSMAVAAVLLGGCGPYTELLPAAAADRAEELPGQAAEAEGFGVHLVASADAWTARPADLTAAIPVFIRIENEGTDPLWVLYSNLYLEDASGRRYPALYPWDLAEPDVDPVIHAYPQRDFQLAPHLRETYPTLAATEEAPSLDLTYYEPAHQTWKARRLPTLDVLHLALPEGVLQEGGDVNGFVYFPPLPRHVDRVWLKFDTRDEVAGPSVQRGVLVIPFVPAVR